MRYVLSLLLVLTWALWFGGQVTLVILIVTLFSTDHDTAVRAGPIIFHVFERYQLVLAALAMLGAASLFFFLRRRILLVILGCLCVAAIGGIVSMTSITPAMEQLWREGKSQGPEFHALHKRSSMVYRIEMVLLLVSGLLLPRAITSPAARQDRPGATRSEAGARDSTIPAT
jgi:hypothetical protein